MPAKYLLLAVVLSRLAAGCDRPLISPGGVVNAASYSAADGGAPGSIVTIFGINLATSTQAATTVPLPTTLAGTSVSVNGVAAPLFYVSPTQINFQMPEVGNEGPGGSTAQGIVAITAACGATDPYTPPAGYGTLGIFTLDASGCGRGAVQNVGSDGIVSLNSPTNSVSPGAWITVYATGAGLVSNPPPDGSPSPSSPLAVPIVGDTVGTVFDFDGTRGPQPAAWAGRAPGWVGVDQVNVQVPADVREGCAVPFQLAGNAGLSQPVPISVHQGGGSCVDPPSASYAEIFWEATFLSNVASVATETDTLTVSLQAAPGERAPAPQVLSGNYWTDLGPACSIPGYRSLDAGKITIQGPGFGPVEAPSKPLVVGQVGGLAAYQATLPSGTIQPGTFTVTASGGADVGPFQSSVQVGPGIQPLLNYAGILVGGPPFAFIWSGGDPNEWVVVSWVDQSLTEDYTVSDYVPASDGQYNTVWGTCGYNLVCPGALGFRELRLQVLPDPLQIPFAATGLSLGGQHQWKYTYRFEGVYIPGYSQ